MTEKFLSGKTALVTGAGRNIGRGIALAFAQRGANVVVNARTNGDEAESVAGEARALGVDVLSYLAEVGDPQAVEGMARAALDRFGAVDILVNNAAARPRQSFLEITVEDWDRVIRSNLSALFYLTRALVEPMMARGWGRIINISGTDGLRGRENRAHNVACKSGMIGLTKAMALEFGHSGITANVVVPGITDTSRPLEHYPGWPPTQESLDAQLPVARMGTSEELGEVCAFLTSEAASYITGQTLPVNGGWHMP